MQPPAFRTVSKNAVAEDIVDQLLSLIREKKLRSGDKLPPEREFAVMMDVSRPSLREALRVLSVMGVVQLRHGSGIYVTALEPARLVEHLILSSLDDSTYLQLFETRKALSRPFVSLPRIVSLSRNWLNWRNASRVPGWALPIMKPIYRLTLTYTRLLPMQPAIHCCSAS